jgi:hypothetical protein
MQDDVNTLDTVDLDGDVDMEKDYHDGDDEKAEDHKEEEVVDEDEEQDEVEDNGKEPLKIGQREILNS